MFINLSEMNNHLWEAQETSPSTQLPDRKIKQNLQWTGRHNFSSINSSIGPLFPFPSRSLYFPNCQITKRIVVFFLKTRSVISQWTGKGLENKTVLLLFFLLNNLMSVPSIFLCPFLRLLALSGGKLCQFLDRPTPLWHLLDVSIFKMLVF